MSEDGRVFLAYVRNVGDILPQNVRTRNPKELRIHVTGPQGKLLEVWDLDDRALVRTVPCDGGANIALGTTRHDFAVFLAP
jgi:hypothetical protein